MRQINYILFLFFSSISGYGQVSLISATNTREYKVREPFNLSIGMEIAGDIHQQTPIKLPDLSKFEVLGNASEAFTFIDPETGVQVKQIVYQLILLPKQTGKIKIGSALVQVNGKVYRSDAFDIIVKDGGRRRFEENHPREVHLSMETENREVYENQPIVDVLKAYGRNFDDFRKVHDIRFPAVKGDLYPISTAKQEVSIENEEIASQIIGSFVVFPEKSGEFSILPALAKLNNDKISSNKLKINVKKLPDKAPESFKNAVGEFKIELTAPNKKEIEIDKPFDIFVKLSGEGNLKSITLPKIIESADYSILKPRQKTDIQTKSKGLLGEITEHYLIVPKKEGEIAVKIEDFTFFNLKEEKYKTLKTDELKINSIKPKEPEKQNFVMEGLEETGHILKKVTLLPISSEEREEGINWQRILAGSFLGIMLLVLLRLRRKKSSVEIENKLEKITTIAETEELLKENISIGKEYYFGAIKNAVDKGDSVSFFENYQELHEEAENQIKRLKNQTILEFLEETENADFVQDFEKFRTKIQEAKYAPVHGDLYEFYNDIVKFYTKIME